MRTTLFNFRNLNKNNIVLEEEKIDSPFLSFFKKYGKYLIVLLMMLAIIALIIGLYYTIKNFNETTKESTNISTVIVEFEKTNEFKTNNMKPLTGGIADILFYKRYGNIGLTEGVILVIKEEPSQNGLVIFYSDGSAKLEANDGNITRIASLKNGNYAINENGELTLGAITKQIKITSTKVLEDGTKIVYYSDNSSSIYVNNKETKLVRNSNGIIIENNRLKEITPSGISKEKNSENLSGIKITYYEDGTIKIEENNNTYLVRNKEDLKIEKDKVFFPNNNNAKILKKIDLTDGSKIIYYTDGSGEIIKENETIIVRKSKDIVYDEKKVIEIVETKYANESSINITGNNKEIKYLNNGGALIKNSNGSYEYVYENSNIKYDENNHIKNSVSTVKELNHKITPDGIIVIDLEDGQSIIISQEGYRMVDTKNMVYNIDGYIAKIIGDEDITADIETSVSDNRFTIKNNSGKKIKYIVALEESDNYKEFEHKKLDTKYLKYNIVSNSEYLENQVIEKKLEIGTVLEGNTTIENETYILYESTLENGEDATVNLGMWLDYEEITNEYQDSIFVGTIKVYSETID